MAKFKDDPRNTLGTFSNSAARASNILLLDKRIKESARMRSKFPDRIPVILEKDPKSNVKEIDKKKFLIPEDLTISQFMFVVRRRMEIDEKTAIFLFIDNTIAPSGQSLKTLYKSHKDDDGFMYITYSSENAFGASCPAQKT